MTRLNGAAGLELIYIERRLYENDEILRGKGCKASPLEELTSGRLGQSDYTEANLVQRVRIVETAMIPWSRKGGQTDIKMFHVSRS